jgi:hypothetical protein
MPVFAGMTAKGRAMVIVGEWLVSYFITHTSYLISSYLSTVLWISKAFLSFGTNIGNKVGKKACMWVGVGSMLFAVGNRG